MTEGAPQEQQPSFSLAEVKDALANLDTDARRTVLDVLHGQAERRQMEEAEQARVDIIIAFAATYERATADNASDSNIEGWYDYLAEQAGVTLALFAHRDGLDEVDTLVRDTAARAYTYLSLEHASVESIDVELLAAAGVPADDLLTAFQQGVINAVVAGGGERAEVERVITGTFRTLADFEYRLVPAYWQHIIAPGAAAMRTALLAAGYVLPELNQDGKYGDDDQLEP